MKAQITKIIILGMMFLGANAYAQSDESVQQKKPVQVSYLRPLLNMVNTNVDYGQSTGDLWGHKTSTRGVQVGASFQAGITSRFSMVFELYYLTRGGQIDAQHSLEGSKTDLRFYTLETPVLARLHLGRIHLNAGPSITYNLSGKAKTEGATTSLSFDASSPNGFKRFDAGVQLGGGYKFMIKQKSLVLDVRYSRGLTILSRSEEMYSRYINISLQVINPWKINPLAGK